MRTLGKIALYTGREYEFLNKSDGTYAIYSENSADLESGFIKIDTDRFMKSVKPEELDFIFEKNTIVKYKGDEFTGSIIENDKIMLYTRDAALGRKYNMIQRDKDEYYLYVRLKEIDAIIQQWLPL